MNVELFRRVAWKEYRALRGLWLLVAGLTIICQSLWVAAGALLPAAIYVESMWLYNAALLVAALFALGASAILFAVEREEGTDECLRILPVTAWQLFAPKSSIALLATFTLTLFLMASTTLIVMFGRLKSVDLGPFSELMTGMGLIPFELLAWGLLFSMLTRGTLVAACLGAASASLVIQLSTKIVAPDAYLLTEMAPYGKSFHYRLGLLAIAIAADVWLGRRWLNLPPIETWAAFWSPSGESLDNAREFELRVHHPSRSVVLGHLVWQGFRTSGAAMTLTIGFATLLLSLLASNYWYETPEDQVGLSMVILSIVVAVMGSLVFWGDQRAQRFRFLAERPVSPRLVWFSRQISWLAVIGLWLAFLVPIWGSVAFHWDRAWLTRCLEWRTQNQPYYFGGLGQLPGWLCFVLFMLLAYSAGQVCSLFIRSGVLAAITSLGLMLAFYSSAGLMEAIGVNWMLGTAPIVFIALFVTWLRVTGWIVERNGFRARLRAACSVLLPVAAAVALLAVCRVINVPVEGPGFSVSAYEAEVTPAALETAKIYVRAGELLVPFDNTNLQTWRNQRLKENGDH